MIYTLVQLREYARSLDPRLEDTVVYTDSWINDRIEEGIATAQDMKPVFLTKEKYDLTTNFTPVVDGGDGLTEVEILLQEEPHSIQTIVLDTTYFSYTITYNNHIVVTKRENASEVIDKSITVVYFFHPTLPFIDLEMSMDMYRFVKAGIAANLFSWLSDEQNETYHLGKAQKLSISSTLDISKYVLEQDPDRLGRGTWV